MNKTEMAGRLAARTELSKTAARDAVEGVVAIIGDAVSISASTSPTLKAGTTLKDTVHGGSAIMGS